MDPLTMYGVGTLVSGIGSAFGQKGQTQSGTSTSSSNTQPWGPLQGYLKDYYGGAMDAYNKPAEYYQGNTLVDQNAYTTQGLSGLLGAADFQDQQAGEAYKALMQSYGAADIANNPYVQAMQGSIANTMNTSLKEEMLPAVNAGAALSGGIGGSRQALAQGTAIGKSQTALGDAITNLNLGAYNTGVGARTSALQMAPSISNMASTGATNRLGVGQAMEQRGQQEIDAMRQRFEYYRDYPQQQALAFQQIFGNAPMASSSQGTETSTSKGGGSGIMGLFS